MRNLPLALVSLLCFVLSACSFDRWVEVAAGEYVPVGSNSGARAAEAIEAVRIDRDYRTAWVKLADGSLVAISFVPLPRSGWPAGCPANIGSTRMEVLEIETEVLTVASTALHRPILARDCPPDPPEIVLRDGGEIGGSGSACSGATQCIIFEPAPSSTSLALPRSMKGYELYSWYVDGENAWYYTLVTGTNRLKSYAEVSTPDSQVAELGIVKITVRGEEALKSALALLPENEVVTWVDAGQLAGAPAADAFFPDPEAVREIEDLCQSQGIRLQAPD